MLSTIATGPDGKQFGYTAKESGRAVRRRLPADLKDALYSLSVDGVVDGTHLEQLLAWTYGTAAIRYVYGPQFRKFRQRFEDAQAVLQRFQRISKEMRRFDPHPELDRLLQETEDHFNRWAGLLPFPLTIDGVPFRLNRQPAKRPAQPWKKRAQDELRAAGVPAKLAPRVVTAIERLVAQEKSAAI